MKKRCLNVELMRIFAMLLIFVWHIMGHYLPFVQTEPTTLHVVINYLCLFITFHVDLFVLITGFFGVSNPISGTVKTLSLCIFYALILNILSYITQGHFDLKEVLLPLSHTQWWFMRVYIVLILIAPVIESYIKTCKHLCYLLVLSFFVNVILGFLWHSENFYGHGYDIGNFIFMYLIGAWLRSDDIYAKYFKNRPSLILASIAVCCVLRYKVQPFDSVKWTDYNSPLNIIMAISVFCLFLRIKVPLSLSRSIMFISSSSVSVYLITDHEAFKNAIIPYFSDMIIRYCDNWIYQILFVIIFILTIYIFCCVFDKFRILLVKPINDFISSKLIKLCQVF